MKRSFKALSISILLPLLVSTALSQQSSPTNEKELKLQRQRLQAISMIKQTAAEAPLWENKKAAVQVLADAADVLWDEAPAQGTEWLRKAWELIDQVSGSPKNEKLKEFFTRSEQSDLRTVVLSVARKHDLELAERLLKQLSQKEPDEKKNRGAFDDRTARSEQLLSMAQQVLEANPEEAFALAASSLTDGISYSLQNVLTSLRKKSVPLANRLFDSALARFSSGAPDPSEAQVLAGYLFQAGFTFSANSRGQNILVVNPAQQNVTAVGGSEPERAKSFLIAVYERLLTQPIALDTPEGKQRAQQILVLGNLVARRFAAFAPELAPLAQGFLTQLRNQLMPESESGSASGTSRSTSESTDTTKRLTKEESYEKRISELEDRADKEGNAAFRKVDYVQVALATKPEDYKRAKRIAEKIDDDDLRADAVSFVLYRAALFFVEQTEVEKAIEIAPQISDVSRRAVVKIAIAQRLLAAKTEKTEPGVLNLSQQRAFDLLSDIERDLKKAEPSADCSKILLGHTAVLAQLDPAQAIVALEHAVQMINKLDGGFNLSDAPAPDLGLGVSPSSGATVARPTIGFDLRSAIDRLVLNEFEQVSAVVGRLTKKELNGVGRLEVAKLFLRKSASSPQRDIGRVSRLP